PKLTQAEHNLLRAHHGCFRCRLFYAGHYALECPLHTNGRLTADTCRNVTNVVALKAKVAFEGKGTAFMAAMFGEEDDSDNFDMTEEEADEYVLNLSLPLHLWWSCCIDAPLTCALTPIRVLIDHGSPPVLISCELIEILGLICWKLFKPFSVSGAFIDGKRSLDSSLTEYCKLHLQSPDSVWKSKVVNMVICLNLQTDIILGLDFLTKNKIVMDAELWTAIAKDNQYDLLNPPCATLCIPHSHSTTTPCMIAAIRKQIEELASLKILEKLDSVYKERYADHFPTDIPHASKLPTNVYHHIEVHNTKT
ncbi:hypothetical protein L208DRAFT_1268940, partial [Tricholoma matsutake]